MLEHPTSAWGLGDGGAHCGTTCDASTPTFMLTHWTRDRDHDRLPLEWVVRKMTAETASLYGFGDRGALAPGMLGDVNVIDYDGAAAAAARDGARPARPTPAGSCRAPQGYVATVKRGVPILRDGEDQGARPGKLVRGYAADERGAGEHSSAIWSTISGGSSAAGSSARGWWNDEVGEAARARSAMRSRRTPVDAKRSLALECRP